MPTNRSHKCVLVCLALCSTSVLGQTPGTLRDGTIVAWGAGSDGQLLVPSGIFRDISAGSFHAVARRPDGTVIAWGAGGSGQLALPPGSYLAAAAGEGNTLLLNSAGRIVGVGDNSSGQLNFSSTTVYTSLAAGYQNSIGLTTSAALDVRGSDIAGLVSTAPLGTFRAASVGVSHALALRTDGTLVSWGDDAFGKVSGTPAGNGFLSVDAGFNHSVALEDTGAALGWGDNSFGQCDRPIETFIAASAGDGFTLGVRFDGQLYAWGRNSSGETNVPPGIYTAVAAGANFAVAIRGATSFPGDLHVFGTGPTSVLNRSVAVAGNTTIESNLPFHNRSTLAVGGNLTFHTGLDLFGEGAISVGGSTIISRTSPTAPPGMALYIPLTSAGPLSGDGDLYLGATVRYQFGLASTSAYSGFIELSPNSTLAFSGTGLQTCLSFRNISGTIRIAPGQALVANSFYDYLDNRGTLFIGSPGNTTPAELSTPSIFSNAPTGVVTARSALLAARETINEGGIAFVGGSSDILGKFTNSPTGTLTITSGASATFSDDVVQNGTLVVRKLGNTVSTTVFLGAFSGSGGITGGGDVYFEGDLAPGNSPAAVTLDANVVLGPDSRSIFELAGRTPGTQYDQLLVNGNLELNGTLDIRLLDGFMPVGMPIRFDLISASRLDGDFTNVLFPATLSRNWQIRRTNTTLSLTSFMVIPEPSGLVALLLPALAIRRPRR
jgi:hypothetical protein